jgi:hypothetical protein
VLSDPIVSQTLSVGANATTTANSESVLVVSTPNNSVSVMIPVDPLGAGVDLINVVVQPVADSAALSDAAPPREGALLITGQAFDIDVTDGNDDPNTSLAAPLTLTLTFQVNQSSVDQAAFTAFFYDAATDTWVEVDAAAVQIAADGTVTVTIDHLTLFAIDTVHVAAGGRAGADRGDRGPSRGGDAGNAGRVQQSLVQQ